MNLNMWLAHLSSPLVLAEGETPSPRPSFNPDDVTPGIESFLIVFILAAIILFLVWSMSRHLRRVQVRAKIRAELEQEARDGQEGQDGPGASDGQEQDARDGQEPADSAGEVGSDAADTEATKPGAGAEDSGDASGNDAGGDSSSQEADEGSANGSDEG